MSGDYDAYRDALGTLRDSFAAAAVTGLLSARWVREVTPMGAIAEWAYECADAMMIARRKPTSYIVDAEAKDCPECAADLAALMSASSAGEVVEMQCRRHRSPQPEPPR